MIGQNSRLDAGEHTNCSTHAEVATGLGENQCIVSCKAEAVCSLHVSDRRLRLRRKRQRISLTSKSRRLAEAFCFSTHVHIFSPKHPRTESSSVVRQPLTRGAPMVWHRMTPAIRDRVGHLMDFLRLKLRRRDKRIVRLCPKRALRGRHLVV